MPDLVPVPLAGVPDGLVALARTRNDGTLPRDRRGRAAVRRALLAAEPGTQPLRLEHVLPDVADPDRTWATSVPSRRWDTVRSRLGDRAWDTAVALARAGVLTVHVEVDGVRVGTPRRVELTPPWADAARQAREGRTAAAASLRDDARALAGQVRPLDPGLADALDAARGHEPASAPVLVAAARDLLEGVSHDGPRAFSQAHFTDTKAREDAPAILAAAGAAPSTLTALGLVRSPYLGLGGAVVVSGRAGDDTNLRGYAGPVRFRVGPGPFSARLAAGGGPVTLAVVENLQAAEAVCDAHLIGLAVAWCAGQPADRPLAVIAALAAQADRVLVAPDADWGGVRIAARVVEALPDGVAVEVLDAGTAPHRPHDPFGAPAVAGLARLAEHPHAQIRGLATAVSTRGYAVEQEANVRAVLGAALQNRVAAAGPGSR